VIVLMREQLVIVTPPHTASRNVHRALCSHQIGGYWVVGKWCNRQEFPDQHVAELSPEWKRFTVACVWRDPIQRAEALFRHYNWARRNLENKPDMKWDRYVQHVLRGNNPAIWELFRWRIADFIRHIEVHYLLDFASIKRDLGELLGRDISIGQAYRNTASDVDGTGLIDWASPDYELQRSFATNSTP